MNGWTRKLQPGKFRWGYWLRQRKVSRMRIQCSNYGDAAYVQKQLKSGGFGVPVYALYKDLFRYRRDAEAALAARKRT